VTMGMPAARPSIYKSTFAARQSLYYVHPRFFLHRHCQLSASLPYMPATTSSPMTGSRERGEERLNNRTRFLILLDLHAERFDFASLPSMRADAASHGGVLTDESKPDKSYMRQSVYRPSASARRRRTPRHYAGPEHVRTSRRRVFCGARPACPG